MIQYAIIIVCLSLCIAYFVWHIRKEASDPCRGCDGCPKGKGAKKCPSNSDVAKKCWKYLAERKKWCIFASAKDDTVPWMSGLVNGLQNRLRRFESARHLSENRKGSIHANRWVLSFFRERYCCVHASSTKIVNKTPLHKHTAKGV